MTSMFDCINQSWWRWESPEIFTGQSSVLYSNCIWQSDFMLYSTHIVCFLCLHHLLIYPTMKSASNQIPFILQWKLPQTEPLLPYSETYLKLNPFYPTVKPTSNWIPFTLQWKLPQTEPLLPYNGSGLKVNPFYPTVKPTSDWTHVILQ
jgi:hypothetical protein